MDGARAPADFTVVSHGSVVVFEPQSEAAEDFTEENIALEDWQRWGHNGFAADWREGQRLAQRLADDGFAVDFDGDRLHS